MEFQDLQPIITLLTEQETRLCKKIDAVHDDVRDTRDKVNIQNGRLRKVELKVAERAVFCNLRSEAIDDKFSEIVPTVKASRFLKMIGKNPKMTGLIFFLMLFTSQTVVLLAVENEWIGKLLKALLP